MLGDSFTLPPPSTTERPTKSPARTGLMSILMYANKQVTTFMKYSLGNSLSLRLVQKKSRPEKFPFIATNNWTVMAVWWSVKHFFFRIPQYSGKVVEKGKMEKTGKCKRVAFQVNTKKVNTNFLQIYMESINYFACSFKDFGCAQRFDNLILSFNMVVPFFIVEFAETRFSLYW